MKKIQLFNRDGADMQLVQQKNNQWLLTVDKKHEYCLRYMRYGLGESKNIEFIDPSGGPFLSISDTVDNYIITNIISPTILELSERPSN